MILVFFPLLIVFFFPCLSLLIYVSEFCRTQLITQKFFLFLKAKQWITSDMKVWINTALLTFLMTEHIYSYDNVFFTDFLRTRNLRCVSPLFLKNYNCFTIWNWHLCKKGRLIKQWPLAGEFVEFEYSPKIRHFWRVRVLAKTAIFRNMRSARLEFAKNYIS